MENYFPTKCDPRILENGLETSVRETKYIEGHR